MIKLRTLTSLVFILSTALASAAERVGDFTLLDQSGYSHSMSWYDDHAAIAFLVQTNDSAESEAIVPAFNDLKSEFDVQGVEFMMINPTGRKNREAVQAKLAEYGVDIPVLMDDARMISESLGIQRAGEIFIYDPQSFSVSYRGTIEGAHTALTEILAGEDCLVAFAAAVSQT